MISYDTYQNKIKRVAAVKNFIVRFRALFITLFAAIFALILTIIFIKGMITQDIVLPEKITYGDNYSIEIQAPKALFSDARYQFKRVSEEKNTKSAVKLAVSDGITEEEYEWTYDVPTLAGKYLVRTVTDKTFGKNYGTPKEFEIESCSVEFNIESGSVVYGEMPENYTFDLKNGDKLVTEGVKFVYETELNVNNICANAKSFVILNKAGEDVTFCYDISVTVDPEEVTIVPKDINLAPEPLTVEYDGAAVDYDGALTAKSLEDLSGDSVHYTTKIYDSDKNAVEGTPVNAGTYTVEIVADDTAVYNGDANVTGYYNITYSTATLEIKRRPVTVSTASDNKEYDGTPLVNDACVPDRMAEGHKISASFTGENAITVGAYENRYNCVFLDSDGTDVTANYDITYEYGTLNISHREISVITADRSKIYDGTPLSESDFGNTYTLEKDGNEKVLVEGHTSGIIYSNNISLVAQSDTPNEIEIGIYDAEGNPVSENYEITYIFGTLEISQREISVTSVNASFVYNGSEQSAPEIASVVWTYGNVEGGVLADGEEIIVVKGSGVTYYSGETVANEIECVIRNGVEDTSANYKITYISGTLLIEKRQLTITTASLNWDYDGEYHLGDSEQDTENGKAVFDGLVDGEYAEAFNVAQILNFADNTENNNTTEYKFYTDGTKETETTDCYEIEYVNGTLSINRAPLVITTATLSWVYDGNYHYGNEEQNTENGKAVFDGLADGEFAEAFNVAKVLNVADTAENNNTTEYKFYTDSTKEGETTDNYTVSYIYGNMTVNQRLIIVQTGSDEKEYDGTPLTCVKGWVTTPIVGDNPASYELVENHSLEIVQVLGEITDVKLKNNGEIADIENIILYKVIDENKDDGVNANYDIAYKYGRLKITPRNIQITTANDEWVYDAERHSNVEKVSVHGSIADDGSFIPDDKFVFVSGHELVLKNEYFVEDAGPHDNFCEFDVVNDVISKNYNIVMNYGKLIINPRPIIVTTDSAEKVYDGAPLSCPEEKGVDGGAYKDDKLDKGLVKDHSLNAVDFKTITDVQWKDKEIVGAENVVKYAVNDSTGKDVSGNYEISYVNGTLTIYPRSIVITSVYCQKVYDGERLFNFGVYTNIDGEYDLVDGHNLKVVKYAEITDVQYDDEGNVCGITNEVIFDIYEGERKVNANYDIKYKYGTLIIYPRPIIITTPDDKKVYDGTQLYRTEDGWETEGGVYEDEKLDKGLVSNEQKLTVKKDENGNTKRTEITDVEYKNGEVTGVENIVEYEVVDSKGNIITGNYDITNYIYGTLTIDPRPIIITTPDDSKVYDGTPLINTAAKTKGGIYEGEQLGKGLVVDGHKLTVKKDEYGNLKQTEITNVAYDENGNVTGVENVVEYEVYFGEKNVTGNYAITEDSYVYGTLTITLRPITITTGSQEQLYNGTALSFGEFIFNTSKDNPDSGLLTGGKITHSIAETKESKQNAPSITYITAENKTTDKDGNTVGVVENKRSYEIFDGNNNVTKNYSITCVYGTLTIKQQELAITTATLTWTYDGNYHYGNDGEAVFKGLIDGEFAEAFNIAKIKSFSENAEKNNTTEYKFFTDNTKAVATTLCYKITYNFGTLTIDRIKLNITTITASKVYDGTPLRGDIEQETENGKLKFTVGGTDYAGIAEIVAGEDCKAIEASVKSVTDYTAEPANNTTQYAIYNVSTGESTSENYEITYTVGTLTIQKRIIEIKTQSKELEYNGEMQKWTAFDYVSETEAVEGHSLVPVTYTEFSDVKYDVDGLTVIGEQNIISYKVVDGNESDKVNGNYDIKVVGYGTLTITPRKILITNATDSWEYDGDAHSAPTYDKVEHVATGSEENALVGTHKLVLESVALTVTNVNDEAVTNSLKFRVEKSETDHTNVSGNYELSYEDGEIKIIKRPTTIILAAENSVYGASNYTTKGTFSYAEGSSQVKDEKLEITVKYQQKYKDIIPENAGDYKVVLDSAKIVGGDLDNYDITVKDGGTPFSIAPKPISITLKAQEAVDYNGEEYVFPADGYTLDEGFALVEGDTLTIAVKYKDNAIPLNADKYNVILDNANCAVNGDKQLAKNYEISCSNNNELTIEIKKLEISFDLNDLYAYYSGEEYDFVFSEAITEINTLVKGDYLSRATFKTALNGKDIKAKDANAEGENYEYTVESFIILHADGTASDNYDLIETQPYAKLTILKRPVEVSVWFNDKDSSSSSREYKNAAYDLIEEFKPEQPYGPYKTNLKDSTEFGIYEGELKDVTAKFTFTNKEGTPVELLKDYGEYVVKVSLSGEVLKNYTIAINNLGSFAITERQIKVTPFVNGQLEYNGDKLNKEKLSYKTEHIFSNEKGFNPDSDADNYTAEYYLYNTSGADVTYNILQAGTYVLKVKLTLKDGATDKYYIEYEDTEINVNARRIYAKILDGYPTEYTYNGEAIADPTSYKTYYGNESVNGFVYDDGKYATAAYSYNFNYEAIDAGDYVVRISGFTGSYQREVEGVKNDINIWQNYTVDNISSDSPKYNITIKPATVVVVPDDCLETFNGDKLILKLPESNYTIKYVEGNSEAKLFGDDLLSVIGNTELDIRDSNSKSVEIAAVKFSGTLASNYNVIHTYDGSNTLLSELGLRLNSFKAKLKFIKSALTVKQLQVPEEYRKVQMGTQVDSRDFLGKLGDYTITILDGNLGSGLYAGRNIKISDVNIMATSPKIISKWMKYFVVSDAKGNDVTKGYKITVDTSDTLTHIEVVKREITIKVNCNSSLSDFVSGVTECEVVNGGLVYEETIELNVVEGKLVATIWRNKSDYTEKYDITYEYTDTENNLKEAEYASRI